MVWLAGVVAGLVLFASVLAIAEASISRMTLVRAKALGLEGRRNALLLERIAAEPPRFLNSVYFAVMCAQNGSATLVALLASQAFDNTGLTVVSIAFTIGYFVLVEAMSKTFGVLHSDRAALALAPLVLWLSRVLSLPTRMLIGLANVLLPGKGLAHGPFVSEEEIRSMAEVGHAEGMIEREEKELIHSVFRLGDATIRRLMVPRPDVAFVDVEAPFEQAVATAVRAGVSRLPVCARDLDHVEGVLHIRDMLRAIHEKYRGSLRALLRPIHFVPTTQKAIDVLHEMQRQKFHMAIVVDEYGSTAGVVTLEDLLEELVGSIADEDEVEETLVERLDDSRLRVDAALDVHELGELLNTDFGNGGWNTVGGLVFGVLGHIPTEGEAVSYEGYRFIAERVQGRRVVRVLVEPAAGA